MLNTYPQANVESTPIPMPATIVVIVVVAIVATEYLKALSSYSLCRYSKADAYALMLIVNNGERRPLPQAVTVLFSRGKINSETPAKRERLRSWKKDFSFLW